MGIGPSLAFVSSSPFPELFQAKELESRKDLGDYIIFMCTLCQVFLDIKEKSWLASYSTPMAVLSNAYIFYRLPPSILCM